MTNTPQNPACSPGASSSLQYHRGGNGGWGCIEGPGGLLVARISLQSKRSDEDYWGKLFAQAPETARLLRELVGAVDYLKERLRSSYVYAEFRRGMGILEALNQMDEELTPLLTQIQKLEGVGEDA